MAGTLNLWLDKGKGVMKKLAKPSKSARIVRLKTGDWYIVWYGGGERYRAKLGLNRIKDLNLRSLWANRIVDFINDNLKTGVVISEHDIPENYIPPAHEDAPQFIVSQTRVTVLSYFSAFVKMKNTEGVSKGWITKLKGALRSLREYAAAIGKDDFDFSELGREWATSYKAWRYAPPREHGINYVNKDFGIIKQVLSDAEIEADIEVNNKYKSKAFKIGTVKTDEIALTMAELTTIAALDLSKRKGYELVRDNFVFGCLTGLRYSDWEVDEGNIVEVLDTDGYAHKMISMTTVKTKETILIPLAPLALEILTKHNNNIPTFSNQKSNKYIKDVAQWAGINKEVKLKRSKAGKVITVTKKQYEVVKTHTARRTFITIALFELKIPSHFIMKITGHKTEKQLLDYARIGGEVAALEILRGWDGIGKNVH